MIDAHQHFWRLARGDYGWLTPALAPIHRDFGPDDLQPLLKKHGIQQTILVQAAPTIAETDFLLDIAARTGFVAGVVGWVDFTAADAPDVIARLASNPLLVGLRPMVHDISDDDWLLADDLAPAVGAMIAHDLVFDALVFVKHLSRLDRFVARHPDLAVVIDHGAKPQIRDRAFTPWREAMAPLAANPRIVCKLSGLVTEANTGWMGEDMQPYFVELLELFGPQRLLWGSDWPVVNLAGGYDAWREVAVAALTGLSAGEREAVLGGNAARLYLTKRGRRRHA
jgi:L-fuconolactonase